MASVLWWICWQVRIPVRIENLVPKLIDAVRMGNTGLGIRLFRMSQPIVAVTGWNSIGILNLPHLSVGSSLDLLPRLQRDSIAVSINRDCSLWGKLRAPNRTMRIHRKAVPCEYHSFTSLTGSSADPISQFIQPRPGTECRPVRPGASQELNLHPSEHHHCVSLFLGRKRQVESVAAFANPRETLCHSESRPGTVQSYVDNRRADGCMATCRPHSLAPTRASSRGGGMQTAVRLFPHPYRLSRHTRRELDPIQPERELAGVEKPVSDFLPRRAPLGSSLPSSGTSPNCQRTMTTTVAFVSPAAMCDVESSGPLPLCVSGGSRWTVDGLLHLPAGTRRPMHKRSQRNHSLPAA